MRDAQAGTPLISERERQRREKENARQLAELLAAGDPIPHRMLVDAGLSRPPKPGYWKSPLTEMWVRTPPRTEHA